jgi:hypothetical protein
LPVETAIAHTNQCLQNIHSDHCPANQDLARKEAKSVQETVAAPKGKSRNKDNYVADSSKRNPRPRSSRWTAIEKEDIEERQSHAQQSPCINGPRLQLTLAEHCVHLYPCYRDRIFPHTAAYCICIELANKIAAGVVDRLL